MPILARKLESSSINICAIMSILNLVKKFQKLWRKFDRSLLLNCIAGMMIKSGLKRVLQK